MRCKFLKGDWQNLNKQSWEIYWVQTMIKNWGSWDDDKYYRNCWNTTLVRQKTSKWITNTPWGENFIIDWTFIKQTIDKVLNKDALLAERIRTMFHEEGITMVSILTTLSVTISKILLTKTDIFEGGSPGASGPSLPN